jgi:hypothetical protein
MDKPLPIDIDHINGNNTDNRLENLRYLCPNCHRQTETHSMPHCRPEIFKLNKEIKEERKAKAKQNSLQWSSDKILWPTKEELTKLVWGKSLIALAEELGVSDRSIRKRCEKLNINRPSPGYWLKRKRNNEGELL